MAIYSVDFSAGGENKVKINKANIAPIFSGVISEDISNAKLKLSIAESGDGEYSVEDNTINFYVHECKDVNHHIGLTDAAYQEIVDASDIDNSSVYFVKD